MYHTESHGGDAVAARRAVPHLEQDELKAIVESTKEAIVVAVPTCKDCPMPVGAAIPGLPGAATRPPRRSATQS